jgi:hypothetical protein
MSSEATRANMTVWLPLVVVKTVIISCIKEELGMNPLLVRIGDGFSNTQAGAHNIKNISKEFNCDLLEFNLSIDLYRRLTRYCFEKYANFPFVDGTVYTVPASIAFRYGIKLLVYGENPAYEFGEDRRALANEYGVSHDADIADAQNHIMLNIDTLQNIFFGAKIPAREYAWADNLDKIKELTPIFMSHYVPWSGWDNYQIAKRYGFRDLSGEWDRQGNIEAFDQIDSVGWMVSSWLKEIKFGFSRGTDIASRWIREGRISRAEGLKLAQEHDPVLDQKVLDDFLQVTGYSVREFYNIIDKFYNKDLFEQINGVWTPKFKE